MTKRLMIIDGMNTFMRSYIVDPSLSVNGEPIGGLKGFFKILQKLNREIKPDGIVVVWDGAGGSKKRKQMHKEYKAGRKPPRLNRSIRLEEHDEKNNKIWQLDKTIQYLDLCPVIQLIEDGVEADDLISLVVRMDRFSGWHKIIVSSDKDFFQLCDDETIVFRPIQKEVLNKNKVLEQFGIHPKNFALARAMVGDSSDNLPGVKGVGLLTVAKRLPFLSEDKEYEIDDVRDFCEENESKIKFYKNIVENLDVVHFNMKMMQLSSPSISFQTKKKVDYIFDNAYLSFNKTEFLREALTDGFGHINFNELFASFQRFAREGRDNEKG